MAHDKIYGICESKCFVETMSKDEMIRRMVLIATGEEPITNFHEYYDGRPETTLPYVETHFATGMEEMFNNCQDLVKVFDLHTTNVTNMKCMFMQCRSLTSIPDLDTSNVTNMREMFNICTSLISIPDLDVSNVTDMYNMFRLCKKLTTLRDSPYTPEGKRWQFKDNISFGECPLDRTSILKVFNGLQTVTNKRITISSTTNSYLSDEDKQIAIDKGWTISVQ